MAEIVEVIDAGPGWTQVRDSEGNVFRMEGARNWRNNNPGNLEYGNFAKSLGAVGSDGRFAVFPSYAAGRQAKEQLIFSSPSYRDLTLEQAISRYAPPNENNTRSYINQVAAAAGVPASTPMSQIPQSVRGNMLNAMERVEGFSPGRTYNAQGIPVPPMEIPNTVASALSVRPPAPIPAQQSQDLAQMRNPLMSMSARDAQVTPTGNVPLPRNRPSAPDIVMPSMAALSAQRGNVNATRGVDMLAATQNPVTPRLTADGSDIYSYHIPDMTPTTVTGGIGSLTPSPARVRLPDLPPSASPGPTASQINDAARRAALTANQSNVERNPAPRPVGSSALNIAAQRVEQLSQRPPASARLAPGPIGLTPNTNGVRLNQPPIQVVVPPLGRIFPTPMAARKSAPVPLMASVGLQNRRAAPIMAASNVQRPMLTPVSPVQNSYAPTPLRVAVNGANSYSSPQIAPASNWAPQGYTNNGSGQITSNETGGVYYERHLR